VLKEVEALSQRTEFTLAYDAKILEKCNEANVRGVLDGIVSDYNNYIKARIDMLQVSLAEDEAEKARKQNATPMPVKMFQDDFEATLQRDVIEKSVKMTADVATEFITRLMSKPKKSVATQSLGMKQLFAQQTEMIEQISNTLEITKGENFTLLNENKKLIEKAEKLVNDQELMKN